MKIREHQLPAAQQGDLRGLRLFHFHDQIRGSVNFEGILDQHRAGLLVLVIANAAAQPGPALNQHAVTVTSEFLNAHG